MSEQANHISVSKRIAWKDDHTADDGYELVHVRVADEHLELSLNDLSGMIPPSVLSTRNAEIIRWEVAKYLELQNRAAALRRLPEADRRAGHRARRHHRQTAYTAAHTCTTCQNTGWLRDPDAGTASLCPCCMGHDPDLGATQH